MINDPNKKVDFCDLLFQNFPSSAKLSLEDYDIRSRFISNVEFSAAQKPLGDKLKSSIDQFCKENQIPDDIFFNGAWAILLNRYSGMNDIFYGILLHNSLEVLPARSTLNNQDDILSYLKNLQMQLKQTKKNSINIHHKMEKEIEIKESIHYLIAPTPTIVKKILERKSYPLILAINKDDNLVELSFNSQKYTGESIQNLLTHYCIILEKIIEDPHKPVTHFSILTSDEKYKLLNEWNTYQCNEPPMTQLTHEFVTQFARENPDKAAVTHNNNVMNYQELDEYSNQMANFLIKQGAHSQDIIVVSLERTPCLIVTMLAIFKIGAIYVPINPKYPENRICSILSDSKAKLILCNNTLNISKKFLSRVILLDDDYQILESYPKNKINVAHTSGEDIAYIMYTSGTTGYPKGVMIKHASLMNLTRWYQILFSINKEDRASQFASSGFDSFFCETIPFLSVGASIHIIDDSIKLIPKKLIEWLVFEKITIADLPTAYAMIIFHQALPANLSLKHLKIGGESLARYPDRVLPFDLWNIYGPTEATVEITFAKVYEAFSPIEDNAKKHLPPPIGKPMLNAEVYVVDTHLELVPIGNTGELLLGGRGISSGYWNRMQLTHDKFIKNYYNKKSHSFLYRTGDMVRFLPDGNLEFVGRVDHQIKIRGYRIELNEIKAAIEQYPDISEVVVIMREIANGQKTILAYLVENLDKIRIPYQAKCMVTTDDKDFKDSLSDDISKEGIAIMVKNHDYQLNQPIRINLPLPGLNETKWLAGTVAWLTKDRLGIKFNDTKEQKKLLDDAIEYYFSEHNRMETLQNVVDKRNLRMALSKKLPDYMIPSAFIVLPKLPMTFNGKINWKALPDPKNFENLIEHEYIPPKNETEKLIIDIWKDILNIDTIGTHDNFFDLGGNSLLMAELSVKLFEKFNIFIPVKIFFDLPFVDVIAEYIDSKGKQYTDTSAIQDGIIRDSILNEDITPTKKLHPDLINPQKIFLTGAVGFLGIHLLRDFLRNTNATIYCLIRKKGAVDGNMRLKKTIAHYHLEEDFKENFHRIKILHGDISKEELGLTVSEYNNLSKEIDLICHCAAEVNLMASYSALRQNNVLGTIEIIKLATNITDKPIHYISTLSAAHKTDKYGNFAEEFPDASATNLVGGYALTKWVAERLLTEIKNRGLPVSIYRVGYILGQSTTGIANINESLLFLIKGCIQLQYAPDWQIKILFLPVDFVSSAITQIILYHPTENRVYHIDHPKGILWRDLIQWLNGYGYPIKLCPKKEWVQKLTHILPENALYTLLPQFLAEDTMDSTAANTAHADKIFKDLKLRYPMIDNLLLKNYIQYLNEIHFIEAPEKITT